MFKLYSEKDVRKLVSRLKEEYDGVVRAQREAMAELRAENRSLAARLSALEGERGEVSNVLLRAEREGERIVKESEREAENAQKELLLLAEKCRLLSERLLAKYPDEEDSADFAAFVRALKTQLGVEEESGFDMDEVLSPKQPLDLEKLCRDLGLMEDGE